MNASSHLLYSTWRDMITRCYNPNHNTYKFYGARGITVCEKWKGSFWNFANEFSLKPSKKHHIDRIDNAKGYSLKNCRWVTAKENCRNKSNNFKVTFKGETLTATEWAERVGVHRYTIQRRLNRGWSIEKTLTLPRNENYNRQKSIKRKKEVI